MHKISILWGESPEDGQKAVTYSFATAAELKAFCIGVDAMDDFKRECIYNLGVNQRIKHNG